DPATGRVRARGGCVGTVTTARAAGSGPPAAGGGAGRPPPEAGAADPAARAVVTVPTQPPRARTRPVAGSQ
ncbi:MAG: hypothetical protein AAF800_05650, partial [Planctomycetota bacterium]